LPDKYAKSRTTPQDRCEFLLPRLTGNQTPFVQPRLQAFGLQGLRHALHQTLIGAVMGKKNVEIGHFRPLLGIIRIAVRMLQIDWTRALVRCVESFLKFCFEMLESFL
jgi:hypothetical protein